MVRLTYPYTSPTITLDLPNPILGDARQIEELFSLDYSASGRIYTYKKATNMTKLLLTFQNLTFTQIADLKLFIYKAVNNYSGYKNHRNVQYKGIFINDPFERDQLHRHYAGITLEFRGVKI
jgi:hypothetical protein